jgi:monofunctional chorismate mutase
MISIRGAITVEQDIAEELLKATSELLETIISSNGLEIKRITSIFFTCTKDLTSVYPAKAARELGITNAALMCVQEMHVDDSLKKCIRVCIFYNDDNIERDIKHIYLKNAQSLRPDLMK